MRLADNFRRTLGTLRAAFGAYHEDRVSPYKGEVFIVLRDDSTGAVQERRKYNIVVKDASILLARLVKDNYEPPHGAYVLAVGTGNVGWDPMNPPAPTDTQRALYGELARKTFASTSFIDSGGMPVAYPTNVVDFTTTFTRSEAVGPLVEMGIIGGNVSSNMSVRNPVTPPNGPYDPTIDLTLYETLINYLCFPVINKPATATMTVTWRLTF
jgi:hypothetical protein